MGMSKGHLPGLFLKGFHVRFVSTLPLGGLLSHAAKGAVTVGVAKGASGQGVAVVNLIIRRWAAGDDTLLKRLKDV